uniref:BHLH domain-containing protein n=1 Tax=Globodera rostochiensis TaxID=31243 RepID=A0A914GZU9_GLORO
MLQKKQNGHFMTSNPHTEISPDDEDEDVEVDVVDVDEGGSAVQTADKSAAKGSLLKDEDRPVTFYKFGSQKTQSIVIDQSLNKLNKCIRVAYMKMTTPKWKDFKGLKLQWKHRIRLNNVIWRAYYMEFRKPGRRGKTPYCYFSVPDDDTTHMKIEGSSILEGMYWKRRMEAVCAQYKRWRTYNRNKARKKCCRKRENSCGCDTGAVGQIGPKAKQVQQNAQQRSMTPENMSTGNNGLFFDFDDDLDNEFTNQLFEQLNAPFLFPNPKENGAQQCANADIMQPGLLSLQPSIEEIMSTDYPFVADDSQLIDPAEFVNSLPMTSGEAPPPHFSQPAIKMMTVSIPSQQQQYSTKEYDAATMLVHYNNQPNISHRHPSMPISSSVPTAFLRHPPLANASHPPPSRPSSVAQPALPVPVITPNISHPLYSQAAVYDPLQLGLVCDGQQRATTTTTTSVAEQHQLIISNSMSASEALNGYSTSREKVVGGGLSMATKMANQPSQIPHPITSIASSAASQLLPALNYSILAVSTVPNVVQTAQIGSISRLGPQLTSANSWPTQNNGWATTSQQQQQNYATVQPMQYLEQKTTTNGLFRPSPATSVRMSSTSPLSAATFNAQSLLSPSAALQLPSSGSAPSLANLIAAPPQNGGVGGRQSAIALHFEQQPKTQQQMMPLMSSLSSANSGASTVRQFVMSDLSRYLTQQQSPIGLSPVTLEHLQASPLPSGSPASGGQSSGIRLSTSYLPPGMPTGGLSPNVLPRYHAPAASTPHSAPVLGVYPQTTTKQTQSVQQQHNTSSATLPPPISEQMHPPSKKGRGSGSFLELKRTPHLSRRQKYCQGGHIVQPGPSCDDIGVDTNTTFSAGQMPDLDARQQCIEFVSAPAKALPPFPSSARRWTPQSRRQPSTDTFRLSSPLPSPTSHQQQQILQQHHQQQSNVMAPKLALSRVGDLLKHSARELGEDGQFSGGDSSAMLMATTLLDLSEQIKEEEGDDGLLDEKPPAVIMGHKRRYHVYDQGQSFAGAGSSTPSTGPSSSQSEPADSTLHPEERKRILHLHAEKNRRFALKEGFETLVLAIPVVEQTGVKCTNAVVLNRAAQHIRQLRSEQEQQQLKLRVLREKIASMNERIALIQSNLPSSSTSGSRPYEAPSPSMRIQVEQFFERYKKERSREDFRFWLMGEVLKPIVLSFAEQIHPEASDCDRVLHTLRKWLDTHWNASVLRPIASDVLVKLATASGAFTDETALSNYIMNEVHNSSRP